MTTHNIALTEDSDAPTEVDATVHPCGLLTYRVHDDIEPDSAYRWRVGHHSGLTIAAGLTEEAVTAAVPVLAPLADWTASTDDIKSDMPYGPPSGVWQLLDVDHGVIHPRYR